MSSIKLLDPTTQDFAGNTNYQNLFIFVDFTATRKGRTVLNNENDNITTDQVNVNFMGYNQSKSKNNKIFTTDYSKIYDVNDNTYEGFGITNIEIETNSSYVPKVFIEFVDIKGMSFFNKRESSPYSILFDFPPPIFNLKIKGYYGKTIEYKLHLISQNTRFESQTGNYYIKAEFVGNTFAPLTDILFQNVLMVSKLNDLDVQTDSSKGVDSLAGLVAKSKVIIDTVVDKINVSDEYKDLINIENRLKDYIFAFKDLKTIDDNYSIIKVDKNKLSVVILNNDDRYVKINNEFKLNQLTNTDKFEYFLVGKNLSTVAPTQRTVELKNLYDNIFSVFNIDNSKIITNKTSIKLDNNSIIKIDGFDIINYISLNESIDKANQIKNDSDRVYSNRLKLLDDKVKNVIENELGFVPTVKNVFTIIANDIDKWINELSTVYNESNKFIENRTNFNKIVSLYGSNSENLTKIYPFPDFIENGKKTIPSADKLQMPEILFTDKFIRKFIDYKNEVETQNALKESVIPTDNNRNVWFPINPTDSTFLNGYNFNFPYRNVVTVKSILNNLFARIYVYSFYTNGLNNTFNRNDYRNFSYFFKNENDVIIGLINDDKLLKSLKNELTNITNGNISDQILNYINFAEIKKIINNILEQLKIETNNFSGLYFLNKELLLSTEENDNFKYKNYYDKGDVDYINDDEYGFTINTQNNIVYYDGGTNNAQSSFVTFRNDDYDSLDNIITQSIKFGLTRGENPVRRNSDKIDLGPNINDRIYDYYVRYDNPDNYKKAYGLLNIIYIPNETIRVLFDTPTIVQLPIIVKLYISSLVYAINTEGVLEADLDYFNNNNYKKIIDNSSNKDYIYILYENNDLNQDVNKYKEKITNNREYIINKLKNLSETDKQQYINFYKNTVDLYYNNIEQFFTDNKLIDNQFKFIDDIDEINTEEIDILFDKTIIVNNSQLTYNNDIQKTYNELFLEETIENNIINLLKNNTFISGLTTGNNLFGGIGSSLNSNSGLTGLFKAIIDLINNKPSEVTEQQNLGIQDVRIETYYSFKNFVDRWFTTSNESNDMSSSILFNNNDLDSDNNTLISLFNFVDRASNSENAENIIIDFTILKEFENDYNVNMLTVIGKLLNENGFEFFPLQNFINQDRDTFDIESIFTPYIQSVNVSNFGPKFTCMYVGGYSKYLDSGFNANTTFKNDGIINITDAADINESEKAVGFRVKFGDGRQSLFIDIDLNTEEFQPTNESLKAMSLILDGKDKPPVPIAQNLYSTYEQRSYTCKIKMMGNVMIQPTQFFMLENVPMFRGLYLILKVTHSIEGETNTMYTTFEGIRLPKESRPLILKPFDVYVKRFLNKNLIEPDINEDEETTQQVDNVINVNKEDRVIHLVSGHNETNTGAINDEVTEHELTKGFKALLKSELDNLSINNTIDDDNDSLTVVINKLNEIVNTNDLVIDIHFNASTDQSATGTEVFIKDTESDDIINIAKNIANTISDRLDIPLRKTTIENGSLPAGVKIQSESQYRNLAIFGVNANVLLIEICFITNDSDYRSYLSNKEVLARNIINIINEISISENDKKISTVETFTVLNTLKYTALLDRGNPYEITQNQLSAFNNLIKVNDFTYIQSSTEAGFTSKFTSGTKYTATKLKSYYQNFQDYRDDIGKQIELTSNKFKIDWLVLAGLLYIESKFNPVAISKTGAFGISQFILSSGLLEVLRILDNNKNLKSDVIVFDSTSNTYIEKNISYSEIIEILFQKEGVYNEINIQSLSSDNITRTIKNSGYMNNLIDSMFNNPFISIELTGIYLNQLQGYVNTKTNKNLGILSLSYNTGNYRNEQITDTPYFTHVLNYYNKTNDNVIKNKLNGNSENEGIRYPERLLNEYISKFIDINLDKSRII